LASSQFRLYQARLSDFFWQIGRDETTSTDSRTEDMITKHTGQSSATSVSDNVVSNPNSERTGPFFNGFAIGLFTGAAGYFLFATNEGTKIRAKIREEWQVAQQKAQSTFDQSLANQAHSATQNHPKPVSLRDALKKGLQTLLRELAEEPVAGLTTQKPAIKVKKDRSSGKKAHQNSQKSTVRKKRLFKNLG